MRCFSYKTLVLTLGLSLLLEIIFFVLLWFFTNATEDKAPTDWMSQLFIWFHVPAQFLDDCIETVDTGSLWRSIVGFMIFIAVAVLEWWFIILAGICFFCHFRKKSA
jgi:hypothetical protein